MNPPPAPKLSCRARRFWSAVFGPEDRADHAHLANCEACRSYARAGSRLEASLKKAARQLPEQSAPFLEQRILRAIEKPPCAPAGTPWKLLLSGSLAAGLAVAVLVVSAPHQKPAPAVMASNIPAERSSVDVWSLLPPKAEAILNAEPLHDEAEAVYADTRRALHFLAANFLPAAGDK